MPTTTRPSWWGGPGPTVALPLIVAFATFGSTMFASSRQPLVRPLDVLGVALLAVGPAALVVRRAYPREVLAAAAAAVVVYFGLGYPGGMMPVAAAIALFSAVAAGHHHVAVATAATATAVLVGWYALSGRTVWSTGVLIVLAWLAVIIAAGLLWRFRRERREQVRAALAEEQRRRAGEERLRIAQELHDVLGHHVSLINVQAGVALFLLDDDPEQARTALAEIKRSSRDLLREMRSTLGVLRGVDAEAPHQPTPGLDRLDALLDDVRAAGLPVTLRIAGKSQPSGARGPERSEGASGAQPSGARGPERSEGASGAQPSGARGPERSEGASRTPSLPTGVDLAAYRIVQESLTNTRRHAGATSATVLLRHTGSELEIRVDDDGAGPPSSTPTPGTGLLGMTERAHALGGTLEAGPGPERGFRVRARLPIPVHVAEPDDGTVRR